MKILIVGNGAREHALAWKLRQSPRVTDVLIAPGNAGAARVGTCIPVESSSIIELADLARSLHVDLTIVGPELPLGLGITDEFQKRDLKVFAPSQAAAEIETSKVFAKRFLRGHGIPTADFDVCESPEEAQDCLDRRGRYPVVIKADGLASGKGVTLAADREEARAAIDRMMVERAFGNAGARVIIEDCLVGSEVSFQVLTDGRTALPLATARDYKRLEDGDQGPNTGGMGSVSPCRALGPELGRTIMSGIVMPTLQGLEKEGRRFIGVLYCGLMLCEDGPKVLEYNARLGDPEAQTVLPRLEGDLLPALVAATEGRLEGVRLEWKKEVSVSVVLASGGYPGPFQKGVAISGLEAAERSGVNVFHAGTAFADGAVVTAAGRVLTVNALARSRTRAVEAAYAGVEAIRFAGMQCRRDIGSDEDTGAVATAEP